MSPLRGSDGLHFVRSSLHFSRRICKALTFNRKLIVIARKTMDAPWSGERVRPFIRVLAWVFVLCAIVAFAGLLHALYKEGPPSFDQIGGSVFGAVAAFYLLLVFLKVAITGHAPKGWMPWR